MEKPFVLIIEDDRDIAALFRHVMDLAGYRTDIAANGTLALERLSISLPDVVLLDLTLPGTPAPIDPPKELVATGPYRYVRNPIYLAVLTIIIGHFLWFKTIWMLVYAVAVFLVCHLFVALYEEPVLKRKFGAAYENYCKSVPRWIPKFK